MSILKKTRDIDSLKKEEKEKLLKKMRGRVDLFDKFLVYLLNKRTKATIIIGRIKLSLNQPTYNPEREREVMQRIYDSNKGPLKDESLERIYERILDESRATQKSESPKIADMNKDKVGIKKLLSRKELMIVIAAFIAVLALLIYTFFSPNYYSTQEPVKFEIQKGETLSTVIDSLHIYGIIPNKFNMKVAAFLYGAEKNLKAGRYKVPNGLSYVELADLFVNGKPEVPLVFTVPNGITLKSFAQIFSERFRTDLKEVITICSDTALIRSLGFKAKTLEGYLIPDEYQFYEDTPPRDIIKHIASKFNNFLSDTLKQKVAESKYNLHQIVTMASIVEGESNKVDEFPVIAGVYYNRLKIGMKLQADPTVQYANDWTWRRLFRRDLQIKNPYNTYLYYGLPPGPINSPGREAIIAALYPADHNYIYFVADGNGGHWFSASYNEHLTKVRRFRKIRDEQIAKMAKEKEELSSGNVPQTSN